MGGDRETETEKAAKDPPKTGEKSRTGPPADDPRDDLRSRLVKHRQLLQSFRASKLTPPGRGGK